MEAPAPTLQQTKQNQAQRNPPQHLLLQKQELSDDNNDNNGALIQPLLDPIGVTVQVEEGPQVPPSPLASLSPCAQLGNTHWLLTTAIMLSDMFGLGTLSLPGDFARLGWVPGLICLAWFAAAGVYSGFLYQRLSLRVPRAVVFDEVGRAAMGSLGSGLVYCTVYLTILCEPIIFHLICMETLRQTFYMYNMSQASAFWIVTALIFPLSQVHQMEDVAVVSIFGTVGMLAAMAIVVGKLVAIYLTAPPAAPTELVASGVSFQSAIVGTLDLAFAYGGQINWMRYITTMRNRRRFSGGVCITTAVMTLVYLCVSITGYTAFGSGIDVHKPISSLVGQDALTVAMNAGIFLHCIIAYQVNVNVWSSLLLHVTVPKHAQALTHGNSWSKRLLWMGVTVLCIAFGGVVAVSLPFFSLIMAVIAALGDIMSMFGLPCLFAIKLLRLTRAEKGVCWGLLVLAGLLSAVGVASAVQQLVEAYIGGGGTSPALGLGRRG